MRKSLTQAGAVLGALAVSFAITAIGQGVWGVMAIVNVRLTPAVPWAAVIMPVILAGLGLFLAGRTWLKDGRHLPGVCNIGMNPTTGLVEPRLEVWLFDFDEDIYGEVIETELIAFIRPEEKFDSIEDMLKVIASDAAKARKILGA